MPGNQGGKKVENPTIFPTAAPARGMFLRALLQHHRTRSLQSDRTDQSQDQNHSHQTKLLAGEPQDQQVSTKPHELEKALRIVKSNR